VKFVETVDHNLAAVENDRKQGRQILKGTPIAP